MRTPTPHETSHRPLARPAGDGGFTLLATIISMSVCVMLALVVVGLAIRSTRDSGAYRDRTQAAAAAESAVERLTAQLHGLDGTEAASAWCSVALPSTPFTTTSTYSATVTYWAALADVGTPSKAMACGQAKASATYAQVVGTGEALVGAGTTQVRQSAAVLEFARAQAPAAVATNDVAHMGDYARITAPAGGLAVYAGEEGDRWVCGAHAQIQGDVVVPRSQAVLEDYCAVTGDVRAKTLYLNAYSRITGDVVTQTTPTRETYASIGGTVEKRAAESAWKATPLPAVDADVEVWQARGYTVKPWTYSCTYTGDVATGLTAKTVFDTRSQCPSGVSYTAQNLDLHLGADMVMIVNGFSAADYFNVQSSGGTRRTLTVVRPKTSTTGCTDKENVKLGDYSGRSSSANINLLSGCHVSVHSYTQLIGQVQAEVLWWYNYAEVAFAPSSWTSSGSGFTVVSQGGLPG